MPHCVAKQRSCGSLPRDFALHPEARFESPRAPAGTTVLPAGLRPQHGYQFTRLGGGVFGGSPFRGSVSVPRWLGSFFTSVSE
jgi:hypothetical protein